MTANSDELGVESLIKNFKPAEISISKSIKNSIVHYSPAAEDLNNLAYEEINKMLLETIHEKDSGDYLHITGEMKALSDPIHRKCIRELCLYRKKRFKIIFSLPKISNYKETADNIKKYNKEKWKKATWLDHLDSFDILGKGKAKIYNKYDREGVQYSLFGDNLILFQSYHTSDENEKEVWILQNNDLFKKLLKRAKEKFMKANYIKPIEFNLFNFSLCNDISIDILFTLYHNGGKLNINEFSRDYYALETKNKYIVKNLEIMEFLEKTKEKSLKLLEDGQEYIKLFV